MPGARTRAAMYSAQARSSSARPSSPVTTKVTVRAPDRRSVSAVAPATRKLAHSMSPASATASAPVVPAVVFCTIVRPRTSSERSRAGELARSKPGTGAPSWKASQSGLRALSASASRRVPANTMRSAPRRSAEAATVKARITSTTTAASGAAGASEIPVNTVRIAP